MPGRPKVRLGEKPGTDAFLDEVASARLGIPYNAPDDKGPAPAAGSKPVKGSLRWLVGEYKRRAAGSVAERTMMLRARMLEEICLSGKKRKRGDLPYALMEKKHITEIRDELRETPGARNDVVKALSAMFYWAVKDAGLAKVNPCAGIDRLNSGEGFHTWTPAEVEKYESVHPAGSKARLALHLAMFTGLRIAELAIVGRQHVRDGWITIRPGKTKRSSGVVVEIPVLPELETALANGPTGNMTFLVTEYSKPFTKAGLGGKMRAWCDAADLTHCSMHGLRKAGAARAAENGATENQLMAIFGWTTMEQATLYTKKASRRRMAEKGMKFLRPEQSADEFVSPEIGVAKSETKTGK
jgi:integrase